MLAGADQVVGGVPAGAAGGARGAAAAAVPHQRALRHQEAHCLRHEHHQGAPACFLQPGSVNDVLLLKVPCPWCSPAAVPPQQAVTHHGAHCLYQEHCPALTFRRSIFISASRVCCLADDAGSARVGAGARGGGQPAGAPAAARGLLQRAHQVRLRALRTPPAWLHALARPGSTPACLSWVASQFDGALTPRHSTVGQPPPT